MLFKNLLSFLIMPALWASCTTKKNDLYLITGSFTDQTLSGMQVFSFDQETGEHRFISENTEVSNPSYMAISSSGEHLWVTSTDKEPEDLVHDFVFDKNQGQLRKIASRRALGGSPCYVSASRDEQFLVTANYNGGNLSFFDIDSTGILSPVKKVIGFEGSSIHPKRQKQPYLHSAVFSPEQDELLAADLGRDYIYQLKSSPDGYFDLVDSVRLDSGSGPRHIAFSEMTPHAYVICELSGKVITLEKSEGSYRVINSIEADKHAGEGSADIHLSHDGRFLYASVRGPIHGIAIYRLDPQTGIPESVGFQTTGKHPRNFTFTPNGKYLLVGCRDDNAIGVYECREDGSLFDTGKPIECPRVVCLKWITG